MTGKGRGGPAWENLKYTHTRTHTHTHIYTYTDTDTDTDTHTHAHTHTYSEVQALQKFAQKESGKEKYERIEDEMKNNMK